MRPTTSRTCFSPGCIHFGRGRRLSPTRWSCWWLSKATCSSPLRSMKPAQANNFKVECVGPIAVRWRGCEPESSLARTSIYGYSPWRRDACQHVRRTATSHARNSTTTAHNVFLHSDSNTNSTQYKNLFDKINLATRPCLRVSTLALCSANVSQQLPPLLLPSAGQ